MKVNKGGGRADYGPAEPPDGPVHELIIDRKRKKKKGRLRLNENNI